MIIANNVYLTHPASGGAIAKAGTNVFQENGATDPDSTNVNHILVSGSDRMVYAVVLADGEGLTDISATYGGNAMTRTIFKDGPSGSWATIFTLFESGLPSDGSKSVVLTHTSWVGANLLLSVGQLNNVAQSVTDSDSNSGISVTSISNTLTPTVNGSYILSGAVNVNDESTVINEDQSQVSLFEGFYANATSRASIAEKENTDSGNITLTSSYSASGHHWSRVAIAISPV